MHTFIAALVTLSSLAFSANASAACTNPDPAQQDAIDVCKSHVACRAIFAVNLTCIQLTQAVREFFASSKAGDVAGGSNPQGDVDRMKDEERSAFYRNCIARRTDPGGAEYCWDAYATTAMREEQARAARENESKLRESRDARAEEDANRIRVNLEVKDESIRKRLASDCVPKELLSSSCRYAVEDGIRLGEKVDMFNSEQASRTRRGRLIAASPALASSIAKLVEQAGTADAAVVKGSGATEASVVSAANNSGAVLSRRTSGGSVLNLFEGAVASATVEKETALAEARARALAEQQFQRMLDESGPERLLHVADEMYARGDGEKARAVLRFVAKKYSDRPAARVAANRLIEDEAQQRQVAEARRQALQAQQQIIREQDRQAALQAEQDRADISQAVGLLQETLQTLGQQKRPTPSSGGTTSGPCPYGKNLVNGRCVSGVAQ